MGSDNPTASRAKDGIISGSVGILSRIAIQLCLLGVTVIATRYLPIAEFGIYSIATAAMFLARNLYYVGPYEYLLKTPDREGLTGSCLLANMCLASASATALIILSFLAQSIFHSALVGQVILALTPSIFLAATTSWFESILLRAGQLRRYYACTIAGEVIGAIGAVAALASGLGLAALVAQAYLRLGTILLFYIFLCDSGHGWRQMSWRTTKAIVHWSWSRYGAVFLNFSASYGADLVLGIVLSPAATGLFRASNRIVSALTDLFAQPLQKIVQTNVSARAVRGLKPNQEWLSMFMAVATLGFAALVALAVSANTVVPLVLGEKWKDAAPIVIIFCAVRALGLIDATTTSLLVCYDRQRFMLGVQTAVAIAVPVSSMMLAHLGPAAIATSNGCILLLMTTLYFREAARISGASVRQLGRGLLVALTPALGVAYALYLMDMRWLSSLAEILGPMARLIVFASVGFLIGVFFVRKQLINSVHALGSPHLLPEGL